MAYRKKMSKGYSKKKFRKTASYTHRKNMVNKSPMRGGIRL